MTTTGTGIWRPRPIAAAPAGQPVPPAPVTIDQRIDRVPAHTENTANTASIPGATPGGTAAPNRDQA